MARPKAGALPRVHARVRSLVAGCLVVCACGAPDVRPRPRPVPLVVVRAVPISASDVARENMPLEERRFRDNVEHAREVADAKGWRLARRFDLSGRAAVLVFRGGGRECFVTVDARREQDPVIKDAVRVRVARSHDGLLFDLRGDGARFIVIRLEPDGGTAVLELDGDTLRETDATPRNPTQGTDLDGDGVPEFPAPLVEIDLGPCPSTVCGPDAEKSIVIQGYESWDGATFSRGLAALQPLYARRLWQARAEAADLGAVGRRTKAAACPLDALRVAGEVFTYGVLAGQNREAAIREADAAMTGYSTAPCQRLLSMPQLPRAWRRIRADLRGESLPVLAYERHVTP